MKRVFQHLAAAALLFIAPLTASAQAALPFTSDFATPEGLALWSIVDADADGNTWRPDKSVFGTYDMIYNVGGSSTHNDWLVLAPLPFNAGTSYHVSFTVYSLGDNALHAWLLPTDADAAAFATTGEELATIETPRIYNQVNYEFDFEPSAAAADRSFALQIADDAKASWIYLTNLSITPSVNTNLATTNLNGNPFAVSGHTYKYYARVKNTASAAVGAYSVSLVDATSAEVLATQAATTPLAPGAEAEVALEWTPQSDAAAEVSLCATVSCEGDAFDSDNISPALGVEILPAGSGERIALGAGSADKTMRHPFDLYNSNAAALNVYPASEMLGAQGLVKRISVPYANDFKDANEVPIKIYMANTEQLAPESWLDQSALTLVYDGTADFPTAANSAEITLATPFEYTGGNLAILTVNTIGYGYYNGVYFRSYTPSEGAGALIWHASGKAFDFSGTPSRENQRSAMTLVFCDDDEQTGGGEIEEHFDVSGTVMNAEGKYLIDLPITLTAIGNDAEPMTTTSLAQGRFAFFNLTAGSYRLSIDVEAYLPYSADYVLDAAHNDLGTITLEQDPFSVLPKPQPHVATAPRNLRLTTITTPASAGSEAAPALWLTWDDDALADSFEDCTDFIAPDNATSWTCLDMDGFLSWVFAPFDFPGETNPASFIVFNPAATTPSAETLTAARSGERFLACVATEVPGATNDDWFISPRLNYLSDFTFSFWAQSYRKNIFDSRDLFQVGYSTTGSRPEDFCFVDGVIEAPADWTSYSYEFPADVRYVCLHCISSFASETDLGYMLQIDDVALTPLSTDAPDARLALRPGEVENSEETVVFYNVYVDGERVAVTTAAQYVFAQLSEGEHEISVTKCHYFADTNEYLYSEPSVLKAEVTALSSIKAATSAAASYDLQGRRVYAGQLSKGNFHSRQPGIIVKGGKKLLHTDK